MEGQSKVYTYVQLYVPINPAAVLTSKVKGLEVNFFYTENTLLRSVYVTMPQVCNSSKILCFVFKDFISDNPRQRMNAKGKSISFAFLEILDLAM